MGLAPFPMIEHIEPLVGKTPLLEVRYSFEGEERTVYAKPENGNMTGSIKDRMALHILRRAREEGRLKPGDTITEATSGNTGISFAAIGKALGHEVVIFMPDWMSRERRCLIEAHGARIRLVSREEGGFLGSVRMAEKMAEERDDVFLPRQFENERNPEAHYLGTGPEIQGQLESRGLGLDAFVAGVGTGGTVMGAGRYLRECNPGARIHPLEPANSPTLSTGHKVGKHRIQGISDEFIPAIVKLDELDEVVAVDDGDSIIMAQKIASQLGLGVGISSGANFLGAVKLQNEMGGKAVVATVFSDTNKKYLSTDLLREEPVGEGFLSSGVELLGFETILA